MPVLAEAISVCVLRSAIDGKYDYGWDAFRARTPNYSLCTDGEIARVGFMHPDDSSAFADDLIEYGLSCDQDGGPTDICIVDQVEALIGSCSWISVHHLEINSGQLVQACSLKWRGD